MALIHSCPIDWSAHYLERNLLHWERHGFGLWILYEKEGDDPIGRGVLRHLAVEGVDEVEVGYGFYQSFWGRGLAREVTTACLRLGHDVLKLQTIVAVTSPENHASRRVLERCGLAFERALPLDGVPSVLYRTPAGRPAPDSNPANP
jgi:RimJ/RimL family protein N-acetyltransferase